MGRYLEGNRFAAGSLWGIRVVTRVNLQAHCKRYGDGCFTAASSSVHRRKGIRRVDAQHSVDVPKVGPEGAFSLSIPLDLTHALKTKSSR